MSKKEMFTDHTEGRSFRGYFSFQWHITDNCDQRCEHCYIFAEDRAKPLVSTGFAQMREIIEKCDAFTAKINMRPGFLFTGGDPLLHPDFWRLAELMRMEERPFLVMGNPFHLNEAVCRRLKECGCRSYQVSIDGIEETHDRFRQPGSYRKTMEAVPLIRRAGIKSGVMMTVSEKNYREVPAVMDAAEEAGADLFAFARYVPTSREKQNLIPPLEYRALLDTYIKKRDMHYILGSTTRFGLKEHLLALYFYEEGKFRPPDYRHTPGEPMVAGCHCAYENLAILPDGAVMACRRIEDSVLGNIFTDDLETMWDKAKQMYWRFDQYAGCNRCRLSPWCRGCHAVSCGATGDFFSEDPQCWHVVEK